MRLSPADFSGRVTFITGPGKGCGKTTLFTYLLALLRAEGESPALLSVGLEGEAAAGAGGRRAAPRGVGAGSLRSGGAKPRPRIECWPGEVFVSSEDYLRHSTCGPEVLDLVPGSTALGRLAVARAHRRGQVVLVGPERNEHAVWAMERIRSEQWARTLLVDGAINRITQVAGLSRSKFLYVLRAAPGELDRQLRSMRRLRTLLSLPVLGEADEEAVQAAGHPLPLARVEGPLTAETLARLAPSVRSILVDDFTKIFLEGPALSSLLRTRSVVLRSGIEFGGFVVVLRDLSRERFLEQLDDAGMERLIAFNPYEAVYA